MGFLAVLNPSAANGFYLKSPRKGLPIGVGLPGGRGGEL